MSLRFQDLLATCALFVLFLPAAAQGEQDAYTELFLRAEQLAEKGQNADAIEAYSRALEISQSYAAYAGRGWARYFQEGTEQASLEDFDRALELRPGDSHATLGRGYAHAYLGNAEEALRDLSSYLQESPTDAGVYAVRANVLRQLGRESEALRDQERAAELDPAYAPEATPDEEDPDLDAFLGLVALFLGWAILMGLISLLLLGHGRRALLVKQRKGTQAIYDGKGWELFGIYLQNIVLTLLTLGLYRFWARVRNRRFHYQHTSFSAGRFDYHATGLEKFIGFLKGLVILAPVFVALWFLNSWASEALGQESALPLVVWAFLLCMFVLRPLIMVGAQRFNLARTSWNNLRLRFTGSVADAYKLYARDFLLLVGTLGIYWPWHACRVRDFKLRHTKLGEMRFSFHGNGGELFGILFFGNMLCYATLGLFIPWYIAARYRFFVENTRFDGKRMRSDLTGRAVLAVGAPALLMTILTLGLALPWAITRWRTLLTHSTFYAGQLDARQLESIRDSGASSTLEGLGEAGELLGEIGDLFGA